ncbi:adenylosuccinate synthetase, partial [Francisella tularensis subsp. holarctica]|uniref:adenylosuccinate synthetase n=1 Tax=Francisella tularensis TaxID=263 RepID=UPI002381B27B
FLHLIPSGVMHQNTKFVISQGVDLEPLALDEEITRIQEKGIAISAEKLIVSHYCTIITSYHKLLDEVRERNKRET